MINIFLTNLIFCNFNNLSSPLMFATDKYKSSSVKVSAAQKLKNIINNGEVKWFTDDECEALLETGSRLVGVFNFCRSKLPEKILSDYS